MHLRRMTLGLVLAVSALAGPLAGAAFAATPTTAAADDPAPCDGQWPATVQGVPTLWHAGARAGDYIWHDANGWHLRVTHATNRLFVFSGRIRAGAPMTVTGSQLEGRDRFWLSADKMTLTYRFTNYGHIDGLDIKTACAPWITFGGTMNGYRLRVGRIVIGHDDLHPLQNPFVVRRVL
jgi:hypothetical protein